MFVLFLLISIDDSLTCYGCSGMFRELLILCLGSRDDRCIIGLTDSNNWFLREFDESRRELMITRKMQKESISTRLMRTEYRESYKEGFNAVEIYIYPPLPPANRDRASCVDRVTCRRILR